jgi:hypothetical protein
MFDSSASTPSGEDDQYRRANDAYRSVARWVVSSFGAVAAALVVGLPLTSLGHLHDLRLGLALLCAAIVFAAVLYVVRTASRVLEPLPPLTYGDFAKSPNFDPLRDYLKGDKSMLAGEKGVNSAADLKTKYDAYLDKRRDARKAYENEQSKLNEKALQYGEEDVEILEEKLSVLALFGSVLLMKEVYKQAMTGVYIAIGVAAIGAVGFAYLSSPPADASSPGQPAAHVTVDGPRLLDWPRSCARLYFALDKLAQDDHRVGPLWPESAFSDWDRACGLKSREDVRRALEFLGRH